LQGHLKEHLTNKNYGQKVTKLFVVLKHSKGQFWRLKLRAKFWSKTDQIWQPHSTSVFFRTEDRLDGASNGSPWKTRITFVLEDLELWDLVQAPVMIPPAPTPSPLLDVDFRSI
jgi:hypothetical protein